MLYHFLYPLHDVFSAFNVFRYITFRTIYAVVTAFAMALILGPWVIRMLKSRNIGEKIRDDGPQTHQVKAGTPTMGGIIIIAATLIPTLLWADVSNVYVWIALASMALFGAIGFYDDYVKLYAMRHGVSGRTKLLYQFAAAFVIVIAIFISRGMDPSVTSVYIPFLKDVHPDLGLFYIPFAMLVIVGSANAVNLTDGLDGLAIGPIVISFGAYLVICYVAGHARFAEYLQIPHLLEAGEVTVFCAAVVGASLGFLWYNFYPAMIFMGNIGSTALGGALGTVAVLCKHEIILVAIGGIFVIEALSVMIQVAWFKLTGKRAFRMAPLHHHFEQMGWAEPQVIIRFWVVAMIFALLSLSTLKLR
ncbi:Phospho-N-acetylmuramoyl-pentapeptide-transferase [hydrothermal vent metagenome]|uniref:Phospho-N-acetylmuramoyl-pentapeptide-transferase n=1 Tax=hydrothermal vent metagenome TaxID=652676 RepID=A0A3B1BGC1_9ZZZZ